MLELVTWCLLIYGISNIMVYGSIFNGPRNQIKKFGESEMFLSGVGRFFTDMLKCMMCTPTWVGFFIGIFMFSPINYILGTHPLISWFFDGLLASGSTWIINSIVEWFEENRKN